jgi:recombination protein RecA
VSLSKEALAVIAKVNKTYGEGAVVLAKDIQIHKRYTTGHLGLDVALGGGWPANQPIEVLGRESNGKTAVVLKTLAANMAIDPEFTALWVAAEHYDVDQAAALGVDNSRVIVHNTQAMEEAFQVMLDFGSTRSVDAVILDSYPALVPDEEASKDMDEHSMAIGARLFGKFFRKWGRQCRVDITDPDVKPILGPIIINQFRDKIGAWSPHGTPKTSPGGNAKNYAFYVRVEVARDEFIKVNDNGVKVPVGQTIKVTTTKNKSNSPGQVAVLDFYFRDADSLGFKRGEYDLAKDISLCALLFRVIERRGGTFVYANGQVDDKGKPLHRWQGKDAMFAGLLEDPDLFEEIRTKVLEVANDPANEHSLTEDAVEEAASAGVRTVSRREKAAA